MQHLSFSKLKGVFPGRITLLRKNPEPTDSDTGDTGANGDAIKASSRSSSNEELQQAPTASPTPAQTAPASSPSAGNTDSASTQPPSYADSRWKKFEAILSQNVVDLVKLQEAAWTGIPHKLRPICWRLLLGYEPLNRERAVATVKRKRREYQELVPAYFDIDNMERNDDELAEIKQVSVDVPRTAPEIPFFQQPHMQHVLRRLLYIWGIRHPASGYVQGINDLSTPFMAVFLSEYLEGDISTWQSSSLSEAQLLDAEADTYWCLCKLVERVQDVYTTGQPGIQRCLFQLEELVSRVDAALAEQFQRENVSYYQFAFRWINCLLIREVPFSVAIRLWDTYLAEGMRFGEFLPYACAAFLLHWSKQLQTMEFQDILLFLQKVPTSTWRGKDLEVVLSHAHMLRTSFDDAQSHLMGGGVNGSR